MNESQYLRIDNGLTVACHFHGNNDFILPPVVMCPCISFFSFSLVFSLVSQGHIQRMGRIKDKKESSEKAGALCHDLFNRKLSGQKEYVLTTCLVSVGGLLTWTCINSWPLVTDRTLHVSNAVKLINVYADMDLSGHVCYAACCINLYTSVIIFILCQFESQLPQSMHSGTLFRL